MNNNVNTTGKNEEIQNANFDEIERILTSDLEENIKEIEYLDALVRGVYAKQDFKAGDILHDENVYLAIPLQKGQISCRELMRGEVLLRDIKKDEPITIDDIDSPYAYNQSLKEMIYNRGLEVKKELQV